MGRREGYKVTDSIADRFFPLVEKTDECWLWRGNLTRYGYGRLQYNKRRYAAHRLSFELHHGPIQNELYVCHKCDNPRCVNPAHLFLGDQKANMSDCVSKGRYAAGERSPNAKITSSDVTEIRRIVETGLYTHEEIAAKFKTSRPNVTKIINRYRWRHHA